MSAKNATKKPASAKIALKKTAKAKPAAEASVAEPKATKTRKPREPKTDGKLSALDAAAKVLGESAAPMTTGEMIAAMGEKGY